MSEENLFEMLKLLGGQVQHLTQLVHLQQAEIRALKIYAVANIADLLKKHGGRTAESALVSKITLELYDEHISQLESKFPAIASAIDVRANMSQQDQEIWYLLEKYYPQKEEPPNADNQG